MASNSGAQVMVKVGFDDSGREAFLAGNERAFKKSSDRIAAHEQQARRGSAFSGGQNAAYRTGMISQQAQDVAVSLQMGMSASRVIAQQGSQIASIFGPTGMVIGGVIAIGAAIYEWISNTKEAEKAAKEYAESMKRAEGYKTNAREASQNIAIETARAVSGSNVADAMKQEFELREKNLKLIIQAREIRKQRDNQKSRDLPEGRGLSFSESMSFDETKRQRQEDFNRKNTAFNLELQKIQAEIDANNKLEKIKADARIKAIAAQDSMFAMEKRIQANILDFSATHTDREIEDEKRILAFKLTSRNIANEATLTFDQKAARMESERILFGAETRAVALKRKKEDEKAGMEWQRKENEAYASELAKTSEETANNNAQYDKRGNTGAQHLLDINKQISELQSQKKLSLSEEFDRDLKVSKLKLEQYEAEKSAAKEIETIQRESSDFEKAGLAGTEAQNKRKVIEMEIDLLNKKIAFSPLEARQIANKLELLKREQINENFNMGAMGAGGMSAFNRNRKAQESAQDRAEQRALGNLGLTNIHRGMGGEIIGGIDPVTGKQVTESEIVRRRVSMNDEKKRRDAMRNGANPGKDNITAGFTAEQIAELSKSIADAVRELVTK